MIKKKVKGGLITGRDDVWEETLYLFPKNTELTDYDSTVYYVDFGDGRPLSEFYNYKSPVLLDLYSLEPYEKKEKDSEEALAKASKFKDKFKNAFK